MGLASCTGYIRDLLDGLEWPAAIQQLPSPPAPLACYIQPPNPLVSGDPTAFTWFERGRESRNGARYGAGTVPRAAYPGAPSGTKAIEHTVPVYFVWNGGSPTDPAASSLFPGMVDAIMATLRTSPDPVRLTDPWTGVESWDVDAGETIEYLTYLRDLESQQLQRLDALLTVSVVEVIAG